MNDPQKISESELAGARNDEVPTSGNTEIDPAKPTGPVGYGNLDDVSICATFTTGDSSTVVLGVDADTPPMPPEHVRPYGNTADVVQMDSLRGGLLQIATNPTEGAPTFLVLDGLSYPIPDIGSRRALGYGDVDPMMVPGALISLIESGLDAETNLSLGKITVIP